MDASGAEQEKGDFARDTAILLPRIDGMARTGQRRLVLSAAEALLEGRLEALDQIPRGLPAQA